MTITTVPGRPAWVAGPLYQFMLTIFPLHHTPLGALDVRRLGNDLGKSHEAVYKWLRSGKLTPTNAKLILALTTEHSNAQAIANRGISPLVIQDFAKFTFA